MGYVAGAVLALAFTGAAFLLAQVQPRMHIRLWGAAFGARAVAVGARAGALWLATAGVTGAWIALDVATGLGRLAFASLQLGAARRIAWPTAPRFPLWLVAPLLLAGCLRAVGALATGSITSTVVLAAMVPRLLIEAALLAASATLVLRDGGSRANRFLGVALGINAALPAALAIVLNTIVVQPGRALVGIGLVLAGVPAYWFWRKGI